MTRTERQVAAAIVLGVLLLAIVFAAVVPRNSSQNEKGGTIHATEQNADEIRTLIAEVATLDAQLHNPNLLKDQRQAVTEQACGLIADGRAWPWDVDMFATHNCSVPA